MVGQHAQCIFRSPTGSSYQTTSTVRVDGVAETYDGIKAGENGSASSSEVMLRVMTEGSAVEITPEARASWEREVRLLRRLSAVYSGYPSVPHVVSMVEEVFRMQKKPITSRVLVLTPKPETSLVGRIKNIEWGRLKPYSSSTALRWCYEIARGLTILEEADLFFSSLTLNNIMLSGAVDPDLCSIYLTGFDVAATDAGPCGGPPSLALTSRRGNFDSRAGAMDLGRVIYMLLSFKTDPGNVEASKATPSDGLMEVPWSVYNTLQGLLSTRPSTRLPVRLAASRLQAVVGYGGITKKEKVPPLKIVPEEEAWWKAVEGSDDSDGGAHEFKEARSPDDVQASLIRTSLDLGAFWDRQCNKTFKAMEYYTDAIEHATRGGESARGHLSDAYSRLADTCIRAGKHEMGRELLELLRGLQLEDIRRLGGNGVDVVADAKTADSNGVVKDDKVSPSKAARMRLAATCDLLGLTCLALGERERSRGQEASAQQELQRALGEFVRAEKELQAVATEEATAQLWKVRAHRSTVYRIKGAYDKALRGYEEVMDARRKVLKRNDPEVTTYLVSMARVFAKKGDTDVAIQLMTKAHEKLMAALTEPDTPQPDPLLIADTRTRLGDLYRIKKQPQESLGWYQLALEMKEEHLQPFHPELGSSYHAIGLFFEDSKEPANAAVVYKKALKIRRVTLPPDALETAATLHRLAVVAHALKEQQAALTYYQEAQAILNKWGPSLELADLWWSISSLRQADGDISGALICLYSAETVYRQMDLPEKDPRVLALLSRIEALQAKHGTGLTSGTHTPLQANGPGSREEALEFNAAFAERAPECDEFCAIQ